MQLFYHPLWSLITESFRFKDNYNEDIFNFKFSRLFSKHRHLGKNHCTFFTTKVSLLISIEGGKALSQLLNHKTPNI